MRDLLPADMRAFRRVEDAFRKAASRWGYQEVRTPTIESYSLFTAAGALTPQMLSRVYSFLDWDGWSGERVVLRPDSTIPVVRAATEAALPLPARLMYVQNVFRFSDSGEREDWQLGIEYLDAPPAIGDLEVAAVACEALDELGLDVEVHLGHVGVARAVIDAIGGDETASMALAEGLAESGLAALRPATAEKPQLSAFLDVALQTGGVALLDNLEALAASAVPAAAPALRELRSIAIALEGARRKVIVNLGLPRDFEYYTGAVFEFTSGAQSWGGGGRYQPTGLQTPASACGLGLEAGQLAAHISATTREPAVVAVVPATEGDMAGAIAVARALHRSGIAAAFASHAADSAIAVRVSGDDLLALTPAGERRMASLDDVVGLLLQSK